MMSEQELFQLLIRSTIISGNGYATINVSIDGQMYRLVVSNYRINTFYPY